ncbi:hypothetical protein O6H91_02G002500 [Diphasiastrum complanatum]|uniref:Uncharacterized protein n=1 Tax=Diphasiastrum complanatum TaxID=34168 RepID=A0ACC2ECB0_DIPCM|nr:hypothetical protein O6H91_02G002500 [Diphasiastrum complanatum]
MGNILRVLSSCLGSKPSEQGQASIPRPNLDAVGFAALARDLLHFETTGQVPEGLSNYVTTTKRTQAVWYGKLLAGWKGAKPPPRNAHEASNFVVATLHGHRKVDIQGILLFYDLTQEVPAEPVIDGHAPVVPHSHPNIPTDLWPEGVQYELRTLPVDKKAVADGDTLTVYVDVNDDIREKAIVPNNVLQAIAKRRAARKVRDYITADALAKNIFQSI